MDRAGPYNHKFGSLPESENKSDQMKSIYIASRSVASFLILFYGFAKLNGSQFTVLASELDKPLGQVSGFWLTWYYFGYSPIYGNIIALVQILGGVLLMFRKTTLLGSCLLLPIITNIILVDIFYRIDWGALLIALIIEATLIMAQFGKPGGEPVPHLNRSEER